jgi:serine/threonine protein kinase
MKWFSNDTLHTKFPGVSRCTIDLLHGLLRYDPKRRLTVHQALAHPYFKESPLRKETIDM